MIKHSAIQYAQLINHSRTPIEVANKVEPYVMTAMFAVELPLAEAAGVGIPARQADVPGYRGDGLKSKIKLFIEPCVPNNGKSLKYTAL